MNRCILIIGTGRTGSTFLKDYVKANRPECVAAHQPRRVIKFYSNLFLSGRVGTEWMTGYIRRWAASRRRMLQHRKARIYLQSDPWLYGFTPWLEEAFQSPFVIHMVRDPLTYIPSQLNRYNREWWTSVIRKTTPYWLLRGDKTGDFPNGQWRKAPAEVKTAWFWLKNNSFIEENKNQIRNFLRVKAEDVFAPGRKGLKEIIDFCGLGIETETAKEPERAGDRNYAPGRFPPASAWPDGTLEAVLDICRPLMERYGYGCL
jgi:hypothetical protein